MDRIDFSAVSRAPAPVHVPDQRPTADTAALVKNQRPDIPLPVAPVPSNGISQTAAVTRSLLRDEPTSTTDPTLPIDKRLKETPRILKPYGLSMLPDPRSEARLEAAKRREDAASREATDAKGRETDAAADRRIAEAAETDARSARLAETSDASAAEKAKQSDTQPIEQEADGAMADKQ